MNIIEQINNIDLELILQKIWFRYKRKWHTLSLYDKWQITDWWKADVVKWIITDFTWKERPSWDRIDFICQYFWIDKKRSIKWYIENFNLKVEKMNNKNNPIREKWESLPPISDEQAKYLINRLINPELIDVKNLNWYIALPIRWDSWNIKSIQSRCITDDWQPRYKVLANTDSDWLFYYWIDTSKKYLIVVEWMTDFLSLRQYDTNIVWLINAKNDYQIDIIKSMSAKYEIFFIPDNDEAWQVTINKFKEKWIRFNHFHLENYWVKDINEALINYWLGEQILEIIFAESETPPSNLKLALQKAKEYKKLYEKHWWMLWFSTWYTILDKYISWFIMWKSYLIMAYSNQGKSRFAYSLLKNMIEQKKKIIFFSLEVDVWMLYLEILWALTRKTKEEILSDLDAHDIKEIEKYIEIYDDIRSLENIEAKIKSSEADVVFIDFVQNIEHKWDEYSKMTEIAIALQKSGILTGKTLINLSQVNNESRFAEWVNIQPKWSWALFASSDVIFSLWAKDWNRFLTISKNKYWPAWINFLLNVDYKTSTFNIAEDIINEAISSKPKYVKV